MPKRPKTPPPADDEPQYLTVVHPYPLRATMELIKDKKDFSLWLACCTGKSALWSFFYKPSAPDMVIIEVDRDFDNFKGLLGAHRWSEFLKNPSDEEKNQVTKIFYCKYKSGRDVQKHGWKQVNVEEHWFNKWSPNNEFITYPYPETSWCEVPSEDVTSEPLCRPLPVRTFPPPPKAPAPPVGSKAWLDAKAGGNAPAAQQPKNGAATGSSGPQAALGVDTNVTGGGGKKKRNKNKNKNKKGSAAATTAPSPPIASPVARAASEIHWANGPPVAKSRVSSSRGALPRPPGPLPSPTPVSPNPNVWNKPPSTVLGPPPGLGFGPPPGLGPKPSASSPAQKFIWSDDVEDDQSESVQFDLGSQARGGYGTGPAADAGSDVDSQAVTQSMASASLDDSDSEDDMFPSVHSIIKPNVQHAIPKGNNVWGRRDGGVEDRYVSEEEEGNSVWRDYGADKEDKALPWKNLCKVHGIICKRGVCKEYAMEQMEERKKMEAEERAQKIDKARKKREKKALKDQDGGGDAGPWAGGPSDSDSDADRDEQDDDSTSGHTDQAASNPWEQPPSAQPPANPWEQPPSNPWEQPPSDPWSQGGAQNGWSTVQNQPADDDARSTMSRGSQAAWCYNATPWDNDGASSVSAASRAQRSKAATPQPTAGNDAVSEIGSVKSSRSKAWSSVSTPWDAPAPMSRKPAGKAAKAPASKNAWNIPAQPARQPAASSSASTANKGRPAPPSTPWGAPASNKSVVSAAGSERASNVSHSGWTNVSRGPW
ncbi:hypothetical protein EVG20_g4993 [Dentipellis fragilis]|uniref:Uncharacterized protein n=1 Tax=Dentipellis fragilis TaxID=205917 RepID=A0A4Y9YWJ2_9AGAM|nr:hypothetical protein EVG20_g4993 [Dentipellis fragilis]